MSGRGTAGVQCSDREQNEGLVIPPLSPGLGFHLPECAVTPEIAWFSLMQGLKARALAPGDDRYNLC